jgi:hypothetical protein
VCYTAQVRTRPCEVKIALTELVYRVLKRSNETKTVDLQYCLSADSVIESRDQNKEQINIEFCQN